VIPSTARLTELAIRCQKLLASEAPCPGRHHVGILGDIISECPDDFVGIRIQARPRNRRNLALAVLVADDETRAVVIFETSRVEGSGEVCSALATSTGFRKKSP
jgi:hypothetical protein